MTRDVPTSVATWLADRAAEESRSTLLTWLNVSGLMPLGSGRRRRLCSQGAEHLVDLVLEHLARRVGELLAVDGVLLELRAEGGERERLQQVEHDALGNGVADDVDVARGRHGDHVAQVTGCPQPLQQPEAVTVGQVHVEQDQVDVRVLVEVAYGVPGGAGDPDDLETGDSSGVRGVRLSSQLLVLDDEHPHGHRVLLTGSSSG